MKNFLSLVIAIVVAILAVMLFWKLLIGAFKLIGLIIALIPVIILAAVIYLILRKKVFR